MKKSLKILALVMGAILLVCGSVAATLAYLTHDTGVVQNTFTVGNVTITLDEADVDDSNDDGSTTDRDTANEYKLYPGKNYAKDPTVHVDDASEDCWVFVKVVNGLDGLEATGDTTIAAQMTTNGWVAVAGAANVYAYNAVAEGGDDLPLFASFTIAADETEATLANVTSSPIKIQAYAVQAEGLATYTAAWAAAPFTFTI